MQSRIENAKRNIVWASVSKCIYMFFPFIIRTILIKKLGSEYLGLGSLFTSILTVLSLTEMGFGNAIVYSMYKPIADKDSITICALMNLYKKIYRYIGMVVMLIGLLILHILPKLINGSVPSDVNVYILYLIYLFNTVVSYFLFAYKNCLLTAHQRMDISSKTGIICTLLSYVLQIIAICIFRSYYFYAIVLPIFTILGNCLNAYYASKLFPLYQCKGNLSEDKKKDILKRVGGLFINNLGTVSRNSLDSLVISAYLGLTVVAIYNNYYYIISSIIGILGIVTSSITSSVGNSMCCESVEKNYNDFRRFQYMYAMIVCWCTTCLIVLYQPFMNLWVGADLMFPFYMAIIFAFYFFMRCIGNISGLYYSAAGLWWEGKLRYIVETILNLCFNLVLGYYWGVVGIILASLFTMFAFTYWYGSCLIFRFYFKNGKTYIYFLDNFIYMGQMVLVSVAVYSICSFIPNGETTSTLIIFFLVKMVICILLTTVFMLLIWFHTKRYNDAFNWALKAFRTPKLL